MSNIENYVNKGDLLQLRLNDEFAELLNEYYTEVTNQSEKLPMPEFMKAILHRAIGNATAIKKLKLEFENQINELQNKLQAQTLVNDNSNEILRTLNNDLDKQLQQLSIENEELQKQVEELTEKISTTVNFFDAKNIEIDKLKAQLQNNKLNDNQLLVTLHPLIFDALGKYATHQKFVDSFSKINSKAIEKLVASSEKQNVSSLVTNIVTSLALGYRISQFVVPTDKLAFQIKNYQA